MVPDLVVADDCDARFRRRTVRVARLGVDDVAVLCPPFEPGNLLGGKGRPLLVPSTLQWRERRVVPVALEVRMTIGRPGHHPLLGRCGGQKPYRRCREAQPQKRSGISHAHLPSSWPSRFPRRRSSMVASL